MSLFKAPGFSQSGHDELTRAETDCSKQVLNPFTAGKEQMTQKALFCLFVFPKK